MRTRAASRVAAVLLGWATLAGAGPLRMVVADLPYPRVWEAALRAVLGYPIERAADGWIVTGWRERAPGPDEPEFERVAERVTLRVEPFGEGVSRVTVGVEARGWRSGQWIDVPETIQRAREVLARIRDDRG